MKKFYAFAFAAVAALSMNAQIYLCGNGTGLGWAPESPMEVNLTDGVYKVDFEELTSLKVSTTFGDWDTFNTGSVCAAISEENLGQAVELTPGDGNIDMPWTGAYTVVIAGDLSTITCTTTTPKPSGLDIYLRGGMNDWGTSDDTHFTAVSNEVYQIETTIAEGTEFKIADGNWGNINYGAGGLVYGDEDNYWFFNANNCVMAEDFTGTITITLPEVTRDPLYVVFEEGASVNNVTVDANAKAEYFNLQGVRVDNPANGLYIVRKGNTVSKQLVK